MYGTSNFGHDGDEWVYFPTVILDYGYERVIFVVFGIQGHVWGICHGSM